MNEENPQKKPSRKTRRPPVSILSTEDLHEIQGRTGLHPTAIIDALRRSFKNIELEED